MVPETWRNPPQKAVPFGFDRSEIIAEVKSQARHVTVENKQNEEHIQPAIQTKHDKTHFHKKSDFSEKPKSTKKIGVRGRQNKYN